MSMLITTTAAVTKFSHTGDKKGAATAFKLLRRLFGMLLEEDRFVVDGDGDGILQRPGASQTALMSVSLTTVSYTHLVRDAS